MKKGIVEIINNWNPIEIYPLLKEEYDIEIEKIMEVMDDRLSVQELAEKIFEVFTTFFGKQFTKTMEECERVASEIINL